MKKKFLCLGLAAVISAAQVVPALADKEDDLRQEKAATSSQLDSTNNTIWNLEEKKEELTAEINQMDAQLVDVMVSIDILTGEIAGKEAEIVQTKADLEAAEADRNKQYNDMKLRIQYLYEKGGDAAWAQMLLESEDLSALLSKAEYTQKLYDYDRTSLENYVAVVQQVTDLGNQLEVEKSDLETMQLEYKAQEVALEAALEEKRATSSDYANQIAVAEEQAQAYRSLLEQQTAEIQRIQAEKQRAAEEAARKKAAEEAARQEAAKAEQSKAAKAAKAAKADENSRSSDSSQSNGTSNNNNSGDNSSDDSNEGSNNDYSSNNESNNYPSEEPAAAEESTGTASYSGTGSSVVDYACQFVGNPYVWGGTSLTNGADCSGFIQSVYAKFGVSLPHSSGAMRGSGVGVSYSEAMPGDIICYSGHVAIYMGGGSIVHASNERDGIKISGNAAYRTIVAVRRVI